MYNSFQGALVVLGDYGKCKNGLGISKLAIAI